MPVPSESRHPNRGTTDPGEKKRSDPPPDEIDSPRRSKRSKYAAVACDECKRRKLKCIADSEGARCQRCISKKSTCIYSPTRGLDISEPQSESQAALVSSGNLEQDVTVLRRQMSALIETVADLKMRLDGSSLSATSSSPLQREINTHRFQVPQQPQFVGPTRSAFNIEIGHQSLNRMGIPPNDSGQVSAPQSPVLSPQHTTALDTSFWQRCNTEEVIRLISVFQDEVASVYPCLDTEDLAATAPEIISWGRSREVDEPDTPDTYNTQSSELSYKDFQIAKVVVATALVVEEHGKNDNSTMMVESAERSVSRILKPTSHLKDLQLLTILSIYYFHCDEDLLAWRTIGLAAREALVLGLHRKGTLIDTFQEKRQRSLAMRTFWCIYALDRRWSFGTSLSFALTDEDIDPELPEPGTDYPYLQCMVGYGRLCSSVWKAIMSFGTMANSIPDETIMVLDMKTQEWLESIPSHLQLRHPRLGLASRAQPQVLHRLRSLLYLRGNHIRTLIYRHHLLSSARVRADLRSAWLVVDIAQDSIQVLVHLNATSDIYRRQQSAFNYFLVSAIAVIFLAVCHEPVVFAEPCRKSFHDAVKLIRDFSRGSKASSRLWNSIKGLIPRLRTLGMRVAEENREATAEGNSNSSNNHEAPENAIRTRSHDKGIVGRTEDERIAFSQMLLQPETPQQRPGHQTGPIDMVRPQDGDMEFNGSMPTVFQMSNDLMALFDVLEQGQQYPLDMNMNVYPDDGSYQQDNTMGDPAELTRRFHGLI